MQLSVPTFPKLALMLSIAGLLAGLAVSSVVTPTYISQAMLRVTGPTGSTPPPPDLVEHLTRFEREVLSRASLSAIIQEPHLNLYPEERAGMPLEDVIERMRTRDIRIRLVGSSAFNVAFDYRDRVKARDTVQALLTRFVEANLNDQRPRAQSAAGQLDQVRRLEARVALLEKRLGIPAAATEPGAQLAAVNAGMNLEVIDPPSLPVLPVKPNRALFMAAGFGAGFLAALVIALFRRRPPPMPLPAQTA